MSQESQEILSQAIEAENAGNIQTAFETYHCALVMLFEDAKRETDENKKASLQKIISKYMNIAESLKKQINENKPEGTTFIQPSSLPANVAPSASSNTKSTTSRFSSLLSTSNKETKPTTTKKIPSTIKPDYHDYSLPTQPTPVTPSSRSASSTTPSKRTSSTSALVNKPSLPSAARGGNLSTSKSSNTSASSAVTSVSTNNKPKLKASSSKEDNKLTEYENQIQNDMLDKSPGR